MKPGGHGAKSEAVSGGMTVKNAGRVEGGGTTPRI